MVSEKKVRLMIRLADYEQKQGKKDLQCVEYYKADYIRLQVIKTVACVTAALILIVGLVCMYHFEYILENALALNYKSIGGILILVYILMLSLFIGITMKMASLRYDEAKKKVKIYYQTLNELIRYYKEEESNDHPIGTKK